jgi:hypothetical protein
MAHIIDILLIIIKMDDKEIYLFLSKLRYESSVFNNYYECIQEQYLTKHIFYIFSDFICLNTGEISADELEYKYPDLGRIYNYININLSRLQVDKCYTFFKICVNLKILECDFDDYYMIGFGIKNMSKDIIIFVLGFVTDNISIPTLRYNYEHIIFFIKIIIEYDIDSSFILDPNNVMYIGGIMYGGCVDVYEIFNSLLLKNYVIPENIVALLVAHCHLKSVELLLNNNTLTNYNYSDALYRAIKDEYIEAIELLTNHGVTLNPEIIHQNKNKNPKQLQIFKYLYNMHHIEYDDIIKIIHD